MSNDPTAPNSSPQQIGPNGLLPDPLVAFTDEASLLSGGEDALRVRGLVPLMVLSLVVGIVMSTRIASTRWLWASIAVTGAALLVAWMISRSITRPPRHLIARADSLVRPWKTYPSARVRCFGKAAEIAHVLAKGPIEDRMFEPMIFRAVAAVPETGARRWASGAAAGLAFVAIRLAWSFFDRQAGCCFLDLAIAGPIGMLLGSITFPMFIRVVPGRIDVLEFGFLGRTVRRVHRLDLRQEFVMVDLQQQLVVTHGGAVGPRLAFGAVWVRWGFAHAALTAAVSTHTAPPLPDDALLG